MVSFARLLPPTLFAFLLFTPTASATSTVKHATHRTHYIGASRSLKLEAFHPQSIFESFGIDGVDPHPEHGLNPCSSLETGAAAVSYMASKLGISEDSVHLRNSAQGQMANHAFLVQKINGVPVANAVGNVAFNSNGKVSSFGSSFVEHSGAADINPSVSRGDAIDTAERTLDGTYNGHPTKFEFFVQPDGFAALTYVIQIQNVTAGTWYEAFVDAHNNTLLSVTDFVRKAAYYAIPYVAPDPTDLGFDNITDPQDLAASPNGWHQEFNTTTNQTDGNNTIAFTGLQLINITVQTSPDLNFDYVADLTQDPSTPTNVQAAITNAFYVVNAYHDFAYLFGFTEATFNFQTNNFNKTDPDMGFDRVLVSVQDPRGTNGADFAILPDGQSSEMQLYLFVDFTPKRDSALQNDILLHECQHGATNRMTGGGTGHCFQTNKSSALDEGYADAVADVLSQSASTKPNGFLSDYVFGKDVSRLSTEPM
jgi:extracellular elastinolytic metalloproteinase